MSGKRLKLNLKDRRLDDWMDSHTAPDGTPRWDGGVHGDFASRIRLMGTAGGIFCRANDILALTRKQLTLRSAGFECRVLR